MVEFPADILQLREPATVPLGAAVVAPLTEKLLVVLPGARSVVGELPLEEFLVHGVRS